MVAQALLGPIGAEAGGEQRVEDLDAALDGFDDLRFQTLEGGLQGGCPRKGFLGREKVPERGHERAHLTVGGDLIDEAKLRAHVRDVDGPREVLDGV